MKLLSNTSVFEQYEIKAIVLRNMKKKGKIKAILWSSVKKYEEKQKSKRKIGYDETRNNKVKN